jgi:DNA-binding MarR family transcriptional regulator
MSRRGGYQTKPAYVLGKTGWRILCVLRDAEKELSDNAIARAVGIGNASVTREVPRLAHAGYVSTRQHTRLHRLTDAGIAAANGPCPEPPQRKDRPKKVESVAQAEAAPSDSTTEVRLTVGEYGTLRYLVANPGKSIAEMAKGMHRSVGAIRDMINRLRLHGM